jgi:nitrate reductase gamma subunit
MENYLNNLLFTYLPHIAIAVFWFGTITSFIRANKNIQAKSSQLLADNKLRLGSNLFHIGILAVLLGHFTLFLPEQWYHHFMTTETKRAIALTSGSFFGLMAVSGMLILTIRRIRIKRVRWNSRFHDYFIIILLLFEAIIGLSSTSVTAMSSVDDYASLGQWAVKVISFQPDAGALIAGKSIVYKIHIVIGLFIIMIFPFTKLMHMLVYPLAYFFRSGYQLVRKSG